MSYIEILDNKSECTDCYFEGKIIPAEELPTDQKLYTWQWSSHFEKLNAQIEIMTAYDSTTDFENSEDYNEKKADLDAHTAAIATARIDEAVCRRRLIPDHVYLRYINARATQFHKNFPRLKKPKNYDLRLKAEKIVHDISQRDIQFKLEEVASAKQVKIIRDKTHKVLYNTHGSVTGRLTTKRGSFPILTLARKDRKFIVPTNDLLVEFDFNAAELRVLLALSDQKQPDLDVHEWNKQNICRNLTTRQEAKERFFAWLYNPDASDYMLEKIYDKNTYKQYYTKGEIITPYNRTIKVDKRRALNYLIQSTSSDLNIEQAYKIREKLKGKSSFIKLLLHDSVILDVAKEDVSLLKDLYLLFRDTRFGRFKVNIKTGKNFYDMEKLEWKT